jgi:RNA-directed DNA polymerase
MAVGSLQHRDVHADALEPHHTVHPTALNRPLAQHLKPELDEECCRHLYTYPSKAALAAIKTKVRMATREGKNQPLAILLGRLNPVLRGWTNYFRHGVSKATFNYLRAFLWRRVVCWLRHKHPTMTWKQLRQRYLPGWWPAQGERVLVDPTRVQVTRYRYRGDRIPSPWTRAERAQPTVA